jgi:hypothetical protein
MDYCWRFQARTGRTIVLVLGRYRTKEKAASGGLLYFGEFQPSGWNKDFCDPANIQSNHLIGRTIL